MRPELLEPAWIQSKRDWRKMHFAIMKIAGVNSFEGYEHPRHDHELAMADNLLFCPPIWLETRPHFYPPDLSIGLEIADIQAHLERRIHAARDPKAVSAIWNWVRSIEFTADGSGTLFKFPYLSVLCGDLHRASKKHSEFIDAILRRDFKKAQRKVADGHAPRNWRQFYTALYIIWRLSDLQNFVSLQHQQMHRPAAGLLQGSKTVFQTNQAVLKQAFNNGELLETVIAFLKSIVGRKRTTYFPESIKGVINYEQVRRTLEKFGNDLGYDMDQKYITREQAKLVLNDVKHGIRIYHRLRDLMSSKISMLDGGGIKKSVSHLTYNEYITGKKELTSLSVAIFEFIFLTRNHSPLEPTERPAHDDKDEHWNISEYIEVTSDQVKKDHTYLLNAYRSIFLRDKAIIEKSLKIGGNETKKIGYDQVYGFTNMDVLGFDPDVSVEIDVTFLGREGESARNAAMVMIKRGTSRLLPSDIEVMRGLPVKNVASGPDQ